MVVAHDSMRGRRSPRAASVTRPKRPDVGRAPRRVRERRRPAARRCRACPRERWPSRASRACRGSPIATDAARRVRERKMPARRDRGRLGPLDDLLRAEEPADAVHPEAVALRQARDGDHVRRELARARAEDAVLGEVVERRIDLVDEEVRAACFGDLRELARASRPAMRTPLGLCRFVTTIDARARRDRRRRRAPGETRKPPSARRSNVRTTAPRPSAARVSGS